MKNDYRFYLGFIFSLALLNSFLNNSTNDSQVRCFATKSNGSGYPTILKAGFEIDSPDCAHQEFGPHISQQFDKALNKNVFAFHSHIKEDNDRCKYKDRTRIEIKGASSSPDELQHYNGETSYYRWKFKLPADYKGSTDFCHIFQNKAFGLENKAAPIITITTRVEVLQLIHNSNNSNNNIKVLKEVNLALFKGKWIEGYVKQKHSNSGEIEVILTDIKTGNQLLYYKKQKIDLWRKKAKFNRPKWGLVRKKSSELQNEKILFADFCVSEENHSKCPSDIRTQPCVAIYFDSFDDGYGNWNDGGEDCFRIKDKANSGSHSVVLRDNSNNSILFSNPLDLEFYEKIDLSFSFISKHLEKGEKFHIELSTDGGDDFKKIETFKSGDDFSNEKRMHKSISIDKTNFSNKTVFKFVLDASNNEDLIYFDDIKIQACSN